MSGLKCRTGCEIHGDDKGGDMFTLGQAGDELFVFVLLLLCLHQIFKWAGEVGFCLCVHHSNINIGVSLALSQIMYLISTLKFSTQSYNG